MTWTKKIRIEQIETGSLSGSYFVQGGNSFGTTATLGTNDNQSLQFETNGTTKMFISSSGNVGIGTTSPSQRLSVFGKINLDDGASSVCVGSGAGTNITVGGGNSFIGVNAGLNNTTGSNNSFVGNNTGFNNTSGSNNSFFGQSAGFNNTTGSNNTFIGAVAGVYIADGIGANTIPNNSVFLGSNTKASASNQTNQIVIGHDTTGLGSNTAVLGNTSITTTALRGNVGINTTNPTASLHISGSTIQNIFRAGNSTNPRLLDITGSNVNQIGGNFIVNNSSTQINSSDNIGLQVAPEAWVHINTNPENSKFLRIDAVKNAIDPPTYSPGGIRSVTNVWGNIVDDNVLGTPDFWMEIELNGNGNIVLIPCYTPGT
jgi:hypothetical protein